MDSIKFWAVFAVGVTAGACVALIYAPQSGVKTRRQLKKKYDDASDYVKDAADTLSDHAERVIKQGRGVADSLVSTAQSAAKQVSSLV